MIALSIVDDDQMVCISWQSWRQATDEPNFGWKRYKWLKVMQSRGRPAQERETEPAKHTEGPPGLGTEPSEKPAVVNKFDLLNIEED